MAFAKINPSAIVEKYYLKGRISAAACLTIANQIVGIDNVNATNSR